MGRWNRRKYLKKKKAAEAAARAASDVAHRPTDPLALIDVTVTAETNGSIPGWTWRERRQLLKFLQHYKKGCKDVYEGKAAKSHALVTIGVVDFPALDESAYRQPYLLLPPELKGKQRKMVHECCAESFLFHLSVGERDKGKARSMAISIYVDGFEHLDHQSAHEPEQQQQPKNETDLTKAHHPPIYRYRPWHCRRKRPWHLDSHSMPRSSTPVRTNGTRSLDDQGRSLIEPYIDQPQECLRDELDVLDFLFWDGKDLSDIKPPQEEVDESAWMLVDTAEKLQHCVIEWEKNPPTEIAFDLESYNKSKYCQLTCLLQIKSNSDSRDLVIDPLAPGVWEAIGPALAPWFANPKIVKVGHSIGGLDVRSLHRDFGIFVVNAFDTYEAAKLIPQLSSHGLAAVCAYYGLGTTGETYVKLKEEYQTADWRQRPLTPPMLQYGRYDVHYLLRLRWLLMRDLTRGQLWDCPSPEEEAQRVADSLATTLAQFQREEEDEDWQHKLADPGMDQEGERVAASLAITLAQMARDDDEEDWQPAVAGHTGEEASNEIGTTDFFPVPSANTSAGGSFESELMQQEFDDEEPLLSKDNPKAPASLLRMQATLMQAVSRSQDRCRDLWSGKSEPILTHPLFVDLLHRARRKEIVWTPANRELYEQLVLWRDEVAQQKEILPGFVAPLEFLIPVALQLPLSETTLRRVSYRFPELIEDDADVRKSLLCLVQQSVTKSRGNIPLSPNEDLYRYQDLHDNPRRLKHRRLFNGKVAGSKALKVGWKDLALIAIGIGAGVATAAFLAHRRRLRR